MTQIAEGKGKKGNEVSAKACLKWTEQKHDDEKGDYDQDTSAKID